jgi:class 3 adenylate cyclase
MSGARWYANPAGAERRYLHRMNSMGGERKIATMLFADLVGSTELATELDPEDLRGRLEPFFDAARGALEQHGGTVEKYIGDAIHALFGVPATHPDDPQRALRAADACVRWAVESRPRASVPLEVRADLEAVPQDARLEYIQRFS